MWKLCTCKVGPRVGPNTIPCLSHVLRVSLAGFEERRTRAPLRFNPSIATDPSRHDHDLVTRAKNFARAQQFRET